MGLRKYLLIPDTHVPLEDGKAFALMLKAARSAGAKNVVILGDFADFTSVSSHAKNPNENDLQAELDAVNARLDELDKQFRGEKIYIEGNHEDRLRRYLQEKAPALFNTAKVERLLRLKERGWRFVPYRDHTKVGKVHFTHDVGKAGRLAHYDAMSAFQSNAVIAHTHRLGYAVEGSAKGEAHVGCMLGWLGDFDKVPYMHRVRARRDWIHGFGIMYVEDSGCAHIVPHPIVLGKVVVEGRLIR